MLCGSINYIDLRTRSPRKVGQPWNSVRKPAVAARGRPSLYLTVKVCYHSRLLLSSVSILAQDGFPNLALFKTDSLLSLNTIFCHPSPSLPRPPTNILSLYTRSSSPYVRDPALDRLR